VKCEWGIVGIGAEFRNLCQAKRFPSERERESDLSFLCNESHRVPTGQIKKIIFNIIITAMHLQHNSLL
jgi:hypothetical protein